VVLDAGDSTVGQASEVSRSQEGVAASGDKVADGDATFRGSRGAADAVADGLSDASSRRPSPNDAFEGDRADRGEPLASSEPAARRPDGSSRAERLSVSEARERYPEVARALENAGAQAREAQLRREAGSRDSTRQRVAAIRERLAQTPEGDPAGLDFVWENARANASEELMRAMATDKRDPGIALGTFPIDALISEARALRFGVDRESVRDEVRAAHEALGRALELLEAS